MTAFEERPHSPYYGARRLDAAVPHPARRVRALDRRRELVRELEHEARAALRWIDDTATARRRLRRVRAPQRGDRPGEPVLEGLLGLDLLLATAACPASRAPPASCRATPTTPRCAAPGWPARSGTTPTSPTELEREAAELKRRFNRDFWLEDGEYFALALDADGSQVDALTSNIGHLLWSGIVDDDKAKAVARAPDRRPAVLRLGRAHPGRGRGRLQPDRLPRRHGLAARQLVHRLGPAPLRLQEGGGADRRRHPRRGGLLRRPPARGLRRLPRERHQVSRSSTRPPAARRPGRPGRRCCSSAPCSAWSRSASTWSSTRRSRADRQLGLLDIPGRWGAPTRSAAGRSSSTRTKSCDRSWGPPGQEPRNGGRKGGGDAARLGRRAPRRLACSATGRSPAR